MFLGTFEPNLMQNGRLALPKKIREELAGRRLVLTMGFDNCIFGFTEKMWEQVTSPELSRPLFSDKEGRLLRRKMYAEAIYIELDSQGRFVLPQNMLQFAGISESLKIIGAGDHFEIWDKNKWEEYRAEMIKN